MKTLISSLAVLLLSLNAYAVDTSNCSAMKSASKGAETAKGNYLQVQTLNSASASCPYSRDAKVTISYIWDQETNNTPKVLFWTKLSGLNLNQEATVNTYVTCNELAGDGYNLDTSNKKVFRCSAQASLGTGYQEKLNVEVAPQIDGSWDTRGYSQNYTFKF